MLAVSAHLTDRDRELTRLVARHRVLTTDQLAALAFGSLTTARHRLSVLVRLGVLRRFRPRRDTGSAPWHFVLGPIGAAMLGQEDRDEKKWLPQVRVDRQLALERSQRLGHMTRASWFFVALARHAREHGGGELTAWLSEQELTTRLDQHRRALDDGTTPHPDGLGIWAEGGRDIVFLLEYYTGIEHLPSSPASSPATPTTPAATPRSPSRHPSCSASPPPREQTASKAMAAATASRDLQIATTTLDPRVTCPACGPTWMPLHGGHHPMRLVDLADVLPDPWRTAREQAERERREREHHETDPDADD